MTSRTAKAMGLATAIAVLAIPAGAGAEYFVPPGNSAATQYTEAVPTAGGHRDSEKGGKGGRSPADVLGERKAQRLDEQGAAGREVAEVVATTAPSPEVEAQPEEQGEQRGETDRPEAPADRGEKSGEQAEEPTSAAGGGTGGGPGPSGSSGLAEVLAQATGVSSSGQLGLLLPLAIVGAAAWALAFLLRQRKRPTS